MLGTPAPPDFLAAHQEWRRLFSEAWGTFLLVVVAAGAEVIGARSGGQITLAMKVTAPGLMVMAIIYFMGEIGGAHLNPAVTLAFAARRNFPWRRGPAISARNSSAECRPQHSYAACSAWPARSALRSPAWASAPVRR
jgi:aquaporin Z